MYYCKTGEMLVVNAFYDYIHEQYFHKLEAENAHVTAFITGGGGFVRIPHGEVVLSLEASVPPWYEADRIRCLWGEKVVFIKRKALKKIDASENS